MHETSPGACILRFEGGAAHGPNGIFGAWTVTVDAAGALSMAGQVLGRDVAPRSAALSPGERQALASVLDGLSSLPSRRSTRMGIPGESLLHITAATPRGPTTLDLWHGEARALPPVAALLRWIDAVIKTHAGHAAAFA
ncbi:hypothetical protein BE08_34560 [Sorangium cellulosum]|uniref:Uncharacterized protein n=1 Tax=Sorangium cellulosum TaxID=56 RepID=A0A150PDT8_SORCE|nr:hypothetical protein BE08_34560 [Sorangium cellulosum]